MMLPPVPCSMQSWSTVIDAACAEAAAWLADALLLDHDLFAVTERVSPAVIGEER